MHINTYYFLIYFQKTFYLVTTVKAGSGAAALCLHIPAFRYQK